MGFLSGAYGKLIAGRRVRQIQNELTSVQMQLTRATRQVGNMEKQLTAQEKSMNTMLKMQQSAWNTGIYKAFADCGGMKNEAAYEKYMTKQQEIQYQAAMAMECLTQVFEQQRAMMLEPLKDLEDSLTLRKDSLESQLKLAEQQYEAKKKEEDAGAKTMTPQYTSQG
ncbi:hypothetical protein J6E39_02600 [bacterium]|nr:hypothetical protein [bacterium]